MKIVVTGAAGFVGSHVADAYVQAGHGKSVRPKYVPRRPGEIERICLDISKAERLLAWKPQVSLSEGARRTVSYFQKEAQLRLASLRELAQFEITSD